MIELAFIDDKPKITINGKKVKVYPRLEEGCLYVEDFENISLTDIEDIKLITAPKKIFLHYIYR